MSNPEFSTFRYPRGDKDWYVGEQVQVFFNSRSPQREKLGIAQLIMIEDRELDPWSSKQSVIALITDKEAFEDGFPGGRMEMIEYMEKTYGCDYISRFHKIILRWLKIG